MTDTETTRKVRALVAGLVTLCCVTLLSLVLAVPNPAAVAKLGAGWQCSKAVFVVTTCVRVHHTAPMVQSLRKEVLLRQ